MLNRDAALIIYDGQCVFCSGMIRWLVAHDRIAFFRLVSMHAPNIQQVKEKYAIQDVVIDSLVLCERQKVYRGAAAVFQIASALPFPWTLLSVGKYIPSFIAEPVYRLVARNRHRIMHKDQTCWLPEEKDKFRFL